MRAFSKRDLWILPLGIVAIQILAAACLDSMMFHPVKNGYTANTQGYVKIAADGETVAALVLGPQKGEKAILFCHGNAEDVTSVYRFGDAIRAKWTIAAMDYPGYGLSSGSPTEAGCYRNAHRLYDYLRYERGFEPKDIIVIGYSIGSGVATELAATVPVGGLILEAPFLSAPRAVTRIRLLVANPFPNVDRMAKITCPLLVIHGKKDRIVPSSQGEQLFALANEPKRFVSVPGAGHADFIVKMGERKYASLLSDFAKSLQ